MLLTPEGFPIDSTHRILPRLIPEGSPVDSTHRIPPRLTPEGFPVDSTHRIPPAGTRRGLLPRACTQTLHRTPEGSPIDSTHPNPLRRTPEGSPIGSCGNLRILPGKNSQNPHLNNKRRQRLASETLGKTHEPQRLSDGTIIAMLRCQAEDQDRDRYQEALCYLILMKPRHRGIPGRLLRPGPGTPIRTSSDEKFRRRFHLSVKTRGPLIQGGSSPRCLNLDWTCARSYTSLESWSQNRKT